MVIYINEKKDDDDNDNDDNNEKQQKCELTSSGMNAISAVFDGILLKYKMINNEKLKMNIIHSNELLNILKNFIIEK